MRPYLIVAALSLVSCYHPDFEAARFTCGADAGGCPDGYICSVRGLCEKADAAPCPRGGHSIAAGIYACDSTFSMGGMDAACGPGHHACDGGNIDLLTANVRMTCDDLPGFYASRIPIKVKYDEQGFLYINCDASDGDPALLGCGMTGSEDGMVSVLDRDSCHGLNITLPCGKGTKDWTCTSGPADATHTDAKWGGVLCCRD